MQTVLEEDKMDKQQKKQFIKNQELALSESRQRELVPLNLTLQDEKKDQALSRIEQRILLENEERLRIEVATIFQFD